MTIAALIRKMADAGAGAEAIAIAVEALESAQASPNRGSSAERMARKRARDAANVTSDADVTSHVTECDAQTVTSPLPLPLSPQTPQTPTPAPGDITTGAREPGKPCPSKADFVAWWAVYPRKTDKLKAETAFTKAWGRVEPPDKLKTLIEAAQRYADRVDPGFIKHPATWLNAGSWMDEENPNVVAFHDRTDRLSQRRQEQADSFKRRFDAALAPLER